MIRSLAIALLLAATTLRADPPAPDVLDAATASLDELFFHAQRYGSTPDKKARRELAREEIFNRGVESLDYLISHSDIENSWYAMLAEQSVRRLPSEDAVPVLLRYLADPRERVRKMAVFFLGFYEAPEQAGQLMPLLDDEYLAGVTVRTLGKWRVAEAWPRIAEDLANPKERRRILAVNALRDIGDPGAVPALIAMLDDPLFTVRKVAARALAALGGDALPALRNALPDASPVARRELLALLASEEAPSPP